MRLFLAIGLAVGAVRADSVPGFNRDVRPILSDKCFSCHGPDAAKIQAGLRLDREEAAKTRLPSGRVAIVPGDPAKSEAYQRITSDNQAVRMPPAYLGHEKLSDREMDLIRRWIEGGAQWEKHWSFVPPAKSPLPRLKHTSWPQGAIDHFVLARLEREGLRPSPPADNRTLIRRVTLDLTGLPPEPAEVEAFVKEGSPGSYEKLVDRLLASPRYAERMAIRWLEAARYADTNGYQSDGPRDMWRWRDWVIEAFRQNMPFDQFTVEQMAGDLLPNATRSQKIATGFHRNHRTSAEGGIVDEEFRVEYVADRTETTGTVWLGLTVGCARCHDHKYDPIPQRDFYRLFAFFNSVPEKGFVYNFGNEEPYIKAPSPQQEMRLAAFDRKVAALERRLARMEPVIQKAQRKWEQKLTPGPELDWNVNAGLALHEPLESGADGRVGRARRFNGQDFLEKSEKEGPRFNYQDPFTFAAWIRPEEPRGAILSKAEDYPEGQGHGLYLIDGKIRLHVIFRYTDLGMRLETVRPVKLKEWQHVLVTYDGKMKASGVRIYLNGEPQELKILFDQCIWPIDTKEPWRVGAGAGLRFQGLIDDVRVYSRALPAEEAAIVPLLEPLNAIARRSSETRSTAQRDKLRFCFLENYAPRKARTLRAELAALRVERQRYYDGIPTVMVMQGREQPRETFVLKRGAYDQPAEKVLPAVPEVLPGWKEEWPRNRLGLARWLVRRENPLTARVTVNRFWQMLFGTGLVKTVEDFGAQGEWPLHPELLDWLAVEFVESGWDVKHILKTIVMSATYRQSSRITPELLQRDPENRLLARAPRVRLPAEMIRDQALAVSGLLVEKVGGPSVKPYQPPGLWQELHGGKGYAQDQGEGLYRRSLYTYWKRTVAPPGMTNFDAPTRETCVVRETRTNTPLQALTLMNDVTYLEAARKLAERMLREGGKSAEERIGFAYLLVLGRSPGEKEAAALNNALARFLAHYRNHPQDALEYLKQGDAPPDPKLDHSMLAAYAGVASLVLNLDEAITKE